VLSLALVHLVNDSFTQFGTLPQSGPVSLYKNYQPAGVFVVAGIILMFLTERLSLDAMASQEERDCEKTAAADLEAAAVASADVMLPPLFASSDDQSPPPHSHEHLSAISAARSIITQHQGHSHHGSPGTARELPVSHQPPQQPAPSESHGQSHSHGHGHGAEPPPSPTHRRPSKGGHGHAHAHGALVLSFVEPSALLGEAAQLSKEEQADSAKTRRRRLMTARLLELSIVIHSLVIGLDLGTTTVAPGASARPIVALIIVLCVHQFFEGIALGSYIADLRELASRSAKLLMSLLFALTVPVGCWIGIGVASAYKRDSVASIWVTGSLSGLTGGMLLYSALITFMAEEFSRDDIGGAAGRRLKRRMYLFIMLGAACMALLGIWA
jgi:zinc transporter ZupT